jgi:hypothetical protein
VTEPQRDGGAACRDGRSLRYAQDDTWGSDVLPHNKKRQRKILCLFVFSLYPSNQPRNMPRSSLLAVLQIR